MVSNKVLIDNLKPASGRLNILCMLLFDSTTFVAYCGFSFLAKNSTNKWQKIPQTTRRWWSIDFSLHKLHSTDPLQVQIHICMKLLLNWKWRTYSCNALEKYANCIDLDTTYGSRIFCFLLYFISRKFVISSHCFEK